MIENMKNATHDLTGQVFGKLTVIEFNGYIGKGRNASWLCVCDCGGTTIALGFVLKSGSKKSCGCLNRSSKPKRVKKQMPDYKDKIGLTSKSPEYWAWLRAKSRCFNPNDTSYKNYGAKGITMEDIYKNSFIEFINEVGKMPDYSQRWTLDRIDNSKGYVKGNLRWATYEQQARNKTKAVKNKTGVTGVSYRKIVDKYEYEYYVVHWKEKDENGVLKIKNKLFPILKYGRENAFKLACEYRAQKIAELNALGYGYTENHGK